MNLHYLANVTKWYYRGTIIIVTNVFSKHHDSTKISLSLSHSMQVQGTLKINFV